MLRNFRMTETKPQEPSPSIARPMSDSRPATPREMLGFGLLAAGIGLYFVLVGAGLLPVPGGSRALHAPLWVVVAAGLVFLLAGGSLLVQRAGGAKDSGSELPPEAPRWMRAVQQLLVVALFVSFAVIGSWIAFGPGERAITVSTPFGSGPANEWVGRAAFGVGAVILWLCTIGIVVSALRRIGRRGNG